MSEILNSIWTNDLYRKLIITVLIVVGLNILRRVLILSITQRMREDSPYLYTVRKATSYALNVLGVILVIGLWLERLGDLSIALGLLAAGLAFALQEIIGSFAGWITIITGHPFSVGDRIEISNIRGDVVDVGILRTTLMETGNWLKGNQNTGRIVTVSNAFIFKEPLYNYSTHLSFVWDEISIPVTYESDWRKAIEILSATVRNHPRYQSLLPEAEKQRRQVRRTLAVKITSLEPRVFVKLTDNWIELGMVYPVENVGRRTFRSDVSQQILNEFAAENIRIASQTVAIVQFPNQEDSVNQ